MRTDPLTKEVTLTESEYRELMDKSKVSYITYGDLKEKLENPSVLHDIMILAKDPTLGNTRKEQMTGMLFRYITGKVWCDVNDNEPIVK